MTKLFLLHKQDFPPCSADPLVVETPFGSMHFNCIVNDTSLKNVKMQSSVCIDDTSTLSSWRCEEAEVEFLWLKFPPQMPEGMHVDKCFAGMWRIKTVGESVGFRLSVNLDSQVKPDPDSGECLLAQSFVSACGSLMIGTEDEESLIRRASVGKGLPLHFKDQLKPSHVNYEDQGLEVILPKNRTNDLVQVQFIGNCS